MSAPGSSAPNGGAQQPAGPGQFLGALISLIAKSEIRYQGILAQIDPAESTVSLEQGAIHLPDACSYSHACH